MRCYKVIAMSTAVSTRPHVAVASPTVLWVGWIITRIIALTMVEQVIDSSGDIGYLYDAVTGGSAHEYPPLMLLLPWLLATVGASNLEDFTALFILVVLLIDAALHAYLVHYPGRGNALSRRDAHRARAAWFWVLFGMLAGPSLYMRLDLLPGVFAAACLALITRHEKVASGFLAAATAMKLWPGLLAAGLMGRVQDGRTGSRLLSFVSTLVVLGVATVAVRGLQGTLDPLSYQADRGLQVESVAATPFVLRAAYREGFYDIGFAASKSYEITGPGTNGALLFTSVLMVAVIGFAVAWAIMRLRGAPWTAYDMGSFFVAVALLLIATNKVFSPQYLAWVAPLLAVQLAFLWQPSTAERQASASRLTWVAVPLLLATGLTTYVYPFHYGGIIDGTRPDVFTAIVLALRNLLIVAAAGVAAWNAFAPSHTPQRTSLVRHVKAVRSRAADERQLMHTGLTRGVKWQAATLIAFAGSALRLIILGVMAGAQDESFVDALSSWDAQYYITITENGYFDPENEEAHHLTMAFFPGFPYLLRLVHMVTQLPLVLVALLINFAFLVLLAGAVLALCERMNLSRFEAYIATVAVTCAPLSIVFNMPYTEAMFMALALWAVIAMIDQRWILAGIFVFLVSAVRLTAIDVIVAFAIVVILKARTDWKAWASLILSIVPIAAYLTWANGHLGAQGGYFGIQQEHWNSHFDFGVESVAWIIDVLAHQNGVGPFVSAISMLVVPALLFYSWNRLPLPAWLYAAAITGNVLLSAGIMNSRPRLLLPTVIILIPLAASLARKLGPRQTIAITLAWAAFGAWYSSFMLTTYEYAI